MENTHRLRLLTILGCGTAWWWLYTLINRFNSQPDRAIFLTPRPVDVCPQLFQPGSVVIYSLGVLVLLVWPIAVCWQWPKMRVFLISNAVGTLIGFSIFLLWPVAMLRPALSGEVCGDALLRSIFAVDAPANCFPSFHAFFAWNGGLLIHAYRPRHWGEFYGAYGLAIAVVISTITTGQHYVIDALAGMSLATLCFYLARWLGECDDWAGGAATDG